MSASTEDHSTRRPSRLDSEAEYVLALARLRVLGSEEWLTNSPEDREFDELIRLSSDYERRTFTFANGDPIDAIEFRLDQWRLAPDDLIPLIGSSEEVAAVLARELPLSLEMLRRLRRGLGISADFLVGEFVNSGQKVA